MGYACPVCASPQVDATHLADHLAVTALLGDDDHETWLDEHAPGWENEDDAGLAERIVEAAEEIDLPIADGDHHHARTLDSATVSDSSHEPGVAFDDLSGGVRADATRSLDDDAQAALREAYELTRQRRERATGDGDEDDAAETE